MTAKQRATSAVYGAEKSPYPCRRTRWNDGGRPPQHWERPQPPAFDGGDVEVRGDHLGDPGWIAHAGASES